MQSNMCFAAYSKVKSNLKDKEVPEINKDSLVYFEHDFKESCRYEKVMNIDLKSAYATILYLDQLINKSTYDYLCRLPKHDRLAAVGMLAAKKKIFGFGKKGSVHSFDEKISPLENFFYYAVQRTFEIMQTLKSLIRSEYLFTWVDGIYFLPSMSGLIACENYLKKIGFRYSEEILFDWNVFMVKGAVKLNFIKEGKTKSFALPAKESEFNIIMADAMLRLNDHNSKIKQNEKSKVKVQK